MVNVDELIPAPWNYKKDDEKTQSELVELIKKRGQIQTIAIRQIPGGMEICDGNHRLAAFRQLGIKKVMAYDLGKIDQDTAEKICCELNETRFKPDPIKLEMLLKKFQTTGPKVEVKKIDIQPRKIETPEPKPVNPHESTKQSTPKESSRTKIVLNVEPQIAEQFKEQLNRVKSLMFVNESTKDVADSLPIQAICQVLAETDSKRFQKKP
jgi:hypothetical protein